MNILVTKAATFSVGGQHLTVSPDVHPQRVPDWVRESATFALGSGDGSLVEIEIKTPAPAAPPIEEVPPPALNVPKKR